MNQQFPKWWDVGSEFRFCQFECVVVVDDDIIRGSNKSYSCFRMEARSRRKTGIGVRRGRGSRGGVQQSSNDLHPYLCHEHETLPDH
jgi:hypothetical protein